MEERGPTTTVVATTTTKNKKRARPRPLPEAVTRRNLAIEKRRRQDMNQTFLDLARCVPQLASTKRLSKNVIVMETLQHVRSQRDMCIAAGREVRELLSSQNDLIAEVNALRSQLQIPAQDAPRYPSAVLSSLMDVENHIYGEFPDGFAASEYAATANHQMHSPSTNQTQGQMSLMAPDVLLPEETSAQSWLNYPNGTLDAVPPDFQQAQMPEDFFASSDGQGARATGAGWCDYGVSALNPHMLDVVPWQVAGQDPLLQGYSQGGVPLPTSSSFF